MWSVTEKKSIQKKPPKLYSTKETNNKTYFAVMTNKNDRIILKLTYIGSCLKSFIFSYYMYQNIAINWTLSWVRIAKYFLFH